MLEGHPFRDPPARKRLSALVQPASSRRGEFYAMAVVAAFWNGLCGWQFVSAVKSGEVPFIVLMSLLMIIGAVVFGTAVKAFLAIFNPTVEVLASAEQPALGERLELSWRLAGKVSRVQQLEIELEGVEEANYVRGTDTATDRHTFVTLTIAKTQSRAEIAEGTATVVIPLDGVPSFTASNNKIVWRLIVKADVASWPDIHDRFELDVVAHPRVRRKAAA